MKPVYPRFRSELTENNPILCIKSKSPLLNLNAFDLIRGCDPDGLHIRSGITKQLRRIWFGIKQKAELLRFRVIENVDNIFNSIKSKC